MDRIDSIAHFCDRDVPLERMCKPNTEFGLETGGDQLGLPKYVAARLRLKDAAEDRLEKSELLLDGFRGEPDLPADMALAGGNAALDECELDAVGLIKREPVEIGLREKLAAAPLDPEIVDCAHEIEGH